MEKERGRGARVRETVPVEETKMFCAASCRGERVAAEESKASTTR